MCATLGRKPLTNAAARQVRPPNMNGMSEPVVQLVRTACGSFLLSDSCPDYRSSSEPLSVATKETALSGGGCIVRMAASAKASAFSVGTPVRQSVTARTQARRTPRWAAFATHTNAKPCRLLFSASYTPQSFATQHVVCVAGHTAHQYARDMVTRASSLILT